MKNIIDIAKLREANASILDTVKEIIRYTNKDSAQ